MVATLKKGVSKSKMNELLKKIVNNRKRRGVDTHKYCGVIQLNKDALQIQKEWRDEWQ